VLRDATQRAPIGAVDASAGADYRSQQVAAEAREDTIFKGSLVALITPFQDGAVDETAFQEARRLADRPGHPRIGAVRHDRRIAGARA